MQITNCGRGVHQREIKGIELLRKALPSQWYAFTNLDVALGPGKAREIDLIVVSDRRIFLIDIKDWYGRITSKDGRWLLDGVDKDSSPVAKVNGIARDIFIKLADAQRRRPELKTMPVPRVEGLVVLTNKADRSGITELEKSKVFTADEFIRAVTDPKKEWQTFGETKPQILRQPLTEAFWKIPLLKFFNAGPDSPFRPSHRRFQGYLADDGVRFAHPKDVYREYDAHDEGSPNNLGTLRMWDFTKCEDARFQSEEGRLEIAGREQEVYQWLRDRDPDVESSLLPPKLHDSERSVRYWEIYDRRRRMRRLFDFVSAEAGSLQPSQRVDLARQLLAAVGRIHRQDAAHLDLGGHSIWLESPTTVRLSHLLAARYPDTRSLGNARFQFLSSVQLPEEVYGVDSGPKRRDVFLTGFAVHTLLFGECPAGEPAEWNPAIDQKNQFEALHHWFAQALENDPKHRFADVVAAHESFNKATAARPTPDEIQTELGRFRGATRSQGQLMRAYPAAGDPILESDRQEIWRSTHDGLPVIVKLWRQAAWGDIQRNGASILAFLERAANLKADRPEGLSPLRAILWLGDSFALVQDWIKGSALAGILTGQESQLESVADVLGFLNRLIRIVEDMHGSGFGHGDLKPANIVVTAEGKPFLIDALDFSPAPDGEKMSSAYAPEAGNRMERDRYALTKIAEELFARVSFDPETTAALARAIRDCREKEPSLSTLSPLGDAVERALADLSRGDGRDAGAEPARLTISAIDMQTGPIAPDEGCLFVRLRFNREYGALSLVVRGACEEVGFRLNQERKPFSAWRRALTQQDIARFARHEFHKLTSELVVVSSGSTNLSEIEPLLDDPVVRLRIDDILAAPGPQGAAEEEGADAPSEDQAEDRLSEEIAAAPVVPGSEEIDVPKLWRALIEVETEMTTEGVAQLDSVYDRQADAHRVSIELERGEFDYKRDDTVAVERQDRKGIWRKIGELQLHSQRLDSDKVLIAANSIIKGRLIEAGQRLRFTSHFEFQSLHRRRDAVNRVLAGDGRAGELLSVFDPRSGATPSRVDHVIDEADLQFYDLNQDQKNAFGQIVNARPIGLLQGPPGTGKTRFIAALTHYAITKGLARNVLLASQANEAVNNAAEAVLSLFAKSGGIPSMLRVGSNEGISSAFEPYHATKVEQAYRDRFAGSFAERIALAGRAIGLASGVVADIAALETTVRPIVSRINDLAGKAETDKQRMDGLIETLRQHLASLNMEDFLAADADQDYWSSFIDAAADKVVERHRGSPAVSSDKVERLRQVCAIGRDFTGTVSRAQRSFETFLAGTRQIVVGTCVGLGRTSLELTTSAFDLVIVDEAARCTASELLVPLQAARWAVLVGDQAQLQPTHEPEVINQVAARTLISKREIQRSDFERVFETPYGHAASSALTTQYRMLPAIGSLVSETFYPKLKLVPGRSDPEIDPALLPPGLGKTLTWVETDGLGAAAFEREEDNSYTNKVEAEGIVLLLEDWLSHERFREWLESYRRHSAGIGVICMYAAQRDFIERKLRQSTVGDLLNRGIKVGTVDSYQGKENPVVIVSLVRNNENGRAEGGVRRIKQGFLSTPNRINVAVSRAMDRLVIVGPRRRWRSEGPVDRINQAFERQIAADAASVVRIETILDQEHGRREQAQSRRADRKAGGAYERA